MRRIVNATWYMVPSAVTPAMLNRDILNLLGLPMQSVNAGCWVRKRPRCQVGKEEVIQVVLAPSLSERKLRLALLQLRNAGPEKQFRCQASTSIHPPRVRSESPDSITEPCRTWRTTARTSLNKARGLINPSFLKPREGPPGPLAHGYECPLRTSITLTCHP